MFRPGDGVAYAAPGHHLMKCAWLLGDGDSKGASLRVARLDYEPGAHVEAAASPLAKIYVCLEGTLDVEAGDAMMTLVPGDLWYVPAGVSRQMFNRADTAASALLFMPLPV